MEKREWQHLLHHPRVAEIHKPRAQRYGLPLRESDSGECGVEVLVRKARAAAFTPLILAQSKSTIYLRVILAQRGSIDRRLKGMDSRCARVTGWKREPCLKVIGLIKSREYHSDFNHPRFDYFFTAQIFHANHGALFAVFQCFTQGGGGNAVVVGDHFYLLAAAY